MDILFTILIIIVAILLIGVVLIQNSKGGGLASNIGISTQMMGVKKTADAVEKATWYMVVALVVLCIGSGYAFSDGKRRTGGGGNKPEIITPEMTMPMNPTMPTTMPGQPQNPAGGGNQPAQ